MSSRIRPISKFILLGKDLLFLHPAAERWVSMNLTLQFNNIEDVGIRDAFSRLLSEKHSALPVMAIDKTIMEPSKLKKPFRLLQATDDAGAFDAFTNFFFQIPSSLSPLSGDNGQPFD